MVVRVAHAEIVQDGNALGIGTHGDELAHAFIHTGPAHEMRLRLAPLRQERDGEGGVLLRAFHANDGPVLRRIAAGTSEGLEHRVALHFVIVFADDGLA